MRKIIKPLLAGLASLCLAFPTLASDSYGSDSLSSEASCHGQWFNPISDTDWNNLFPITIMGIQMGENANPPLMYEPPICECPGKLFGIPSIGVGITYWKATHVAEVERSPGCLSTMGGIVVLDGYAAQHSEQANNEATTGSTVSRMQVHWYDYPLFDMLDIFSEMGCVSSSMSFDLGGITEPNPLWQDDTWGALMNPESSLFANLIAQASCAVDAVASSTAFPLDAMFWCSGTWGGSYPLTGNGNQSDSGYQLNNLILGKYLAYSARTGTLWTTIGPGALCSPYPNPIITKSQFRFNQIGPWPRAGKPVVFGDPGLFQYPTSANSPTRESSATLLWQGQQCCNTFW